MTEMHSDRRACETGSAVDLLFTLFFISLFLVQLAHHQMWRDELNVFGIAMASPNFSSLIQHVHYEGHPSFWYVAVWISTRFIKTPLALKVVEAVIGSGIYLVLGTLSPFTRVEKLLLFCSYFVFFEYTVLSRTYGLCFLLVLIYLRCRVCLPQRVILNSVLLGCIANTDVVGCFLSAGLTFEYGYHLWRAQNVRKGPGSKALVAGSAVYAALICLSVWAAKPAADISWRTTGRMLSRAHDPIHYISATVNYMVLPYFPVILNGYPHIFWNPLSLQHPIFFSLLLPLVMIAYVVVFRRDWDLLAMLAIVAAGSIAFAWFVYMGHERNFGATFVALLAGLWIQRSRRPGLSRVALALLVLSAAGGLAAAAAAWDHPFSNVEAAGDWLRAHGLASAELIGTPDTSLASLAEVLGRPVYMPECRCSDTYLLFSSRRDHYAESDFGQRVAEAVRRSKSRDVILAQAHPVTKAQSDGLLERGIRLTPVAQFTGAEESEENYYLYRMN